MVRRTQGSGSLCEAQEMFEDLETTGFESIGWNEVVEKSEK